MRRRLIATAAGIAATVASMSAEAATLRDGYVGCVDEASFDEITQALVRQDERQFDALIGTSCVPVGGLEFSLVDTGWTTARVRVYVGSDSIILWVPIEAVPR